MNLKIIIVILFVMLSDAAFAQWAGSTERSARKDIEKQRWERAEFRLRKSLEKDTLNPSSRYGLSYLFFHADNPAYNLDSAYYYVVTALQDYARVDTRGRDRLHKAGLDSLLLVRHRASIDSVAFEDARRIHTEAAYQEFLRHFPQAEQRELAQRLRDEVAYQDAVRENTYMAFQRYLDRYPEAERAKDALRQYHRLLYEEKTGDQRLSSYIRFLQEHPESPYRPTVYREIFERSTAEGSVERFLTFMRQYPVSGYSRKAAAMAFHILLDSEQPDWPDGFVNDSLQNILALHKADLVPIYRNGRYGFIDTAGREVLPPQFQEIDPDYLCGGVSDDILHADGRLIARNGSVVYDGEVVEWNDLGLGFLLVQTHKDVKVVHKAGFTVADSVDDAKIVGGRFLALRQGERWMLHSLSGRQLDKRPWDEIGVIQGLVVFRSGDKRFVAPPGGLMVSGEELAIAVSEPFDELRPWSQGLLWGRSGEFEGVVDADMNTVIRFDRHRLTEMFFGAGARSTTGKYVLYGRDGRRSSTLDDYVVAGRQLGGKHNGSWYAFNAHTLQPEGPAYDSIRAEGAFLLAYRSDSVVVHFRENRTKAFKRPTRLTFVPGKDSTSFLTAHVRGREHVVYDLHGTPLFTASFDAIEYAGQGIFVVTQKEKKGLLDLQGRSLLPPEYDAIGSVRDDVVSLLRNKRFGAYRLSGRKLIKPQYDRNVVPYGASWAVCYRQGAYGFSSWDDQQVSGFEFEEVQYWNDSVALVRQEGHWAFYDIPGRAVRVRGLRSVSVVANDPGAKIAIVQRDKAFGVVDNQGRELIPATFSDIVNLGSEGSPLFFTEKHIREASLFIVIYYDRMGNMLRKEVYDDVTDYDKIYCTVN